MQCMRDHFHTPSAEVSRLAIGKDVLMHRKRLQIPGAPGLAHCARCGKVIEAPKVLTKIPPVAYYIWLGLLLVLEVLCVIFPSRPIFIAALAASALPFLTALLAPRLTEAFCSWELLAYDSQEQLDFLLRLRRHPRQKIPVSQIIRLAVLSIWFIYDIFLLFFT